jgi:hypothetical protein
MLIARRSLLTRAKAVLPRVLVAVSPTTNSIRSYRGYNRIEDMLDASEAWHALARTRRLNNEQALKGTFDRIDLDASGKIDRYELREALLQARGAPREPFELRSLCRWRLW